MHQYIPEQVDLLQEYREFNNRGRIKNIKVAQTEANVKKFNLNQMPIVLKTKEVWFIKATIA